MPQGTNGSCRGSRVIQRIDTLLYRIDTLLYRRGPLPNGRDTQHVLPDGYWSAGVAAGASASATGGAPPPELGREAEEDEDQSKGGAEKQNEDKEGDKKEKEPGTESFNIQKEKASSIGSSVNLLGRKSARLMKIFLKFECIFFIIIY